MTLRSWAPVGVAAISAILSAACANDGTLQTSALTGQKPAETRVAVDPACATLSSQIDTLRADASVASLEKAASGKGSSVKVKRDTLAKQTELNRLNVEFQAKCGPKQPQTAAVTPAPAQASATSAATATADAAAAAKK